MTPVIKVTVGWLVVVVLVAACGGGTLSLSEYSNNVDEVLTKVDSRLDAHAAELFAGAPNVERTRAYLADRVAGYEEMTEALAGLNPPEQIADLHATLRELTDKLLATEKARAAFAETVESVDDLDQVWEGPEAQAVTAVEREAIRLCYAAQELVDETEDARTLRTCRGFPRSSRKSFGFLSAVRSSAAQTRACRLDEDEARHGGQNARGAEPTTIGHRPVHGVVDQD